MIFDTHAHYNDPRYDSDRDELLRSLPGAGVGRVLMPGTSIKNQPDVLAIAARYDYIHPAVGIHPHYAIDNGQLTMDNLMGLEGYLTGQHGIVAIGECGLDYFVQEGYPVADKVAQRELFDAQLCLAERYKLPVIVHDRDAHEDCIDIVRAHPGLLYVFHCFSGDAEMVELLCGMGVYISFAGGVTYKKNTALRQAAAAVPNELLLVETDAPYLAPEPLRGKRCDSLMLTHILEVLAQARGQTVEEVEQHTWDNGHKAFAIEK